MTKPSAKEIAEVAKESMEEYSSLVSDIRVIRRKFAGKHCNFCKLSRRYNVDCEDCVVREVIDGSCTVYLTDIIERFNYLEDALEAVERKSEEIHRKYLED